MKNVMFAICLFILIPSVSAGGDYVIGEGDTLGISVWGEEALSSSVKVRPDGKITIPALGEMTASGLKPSELQEALTEALGNLVKNPVVTVRVEEITNNKVFVFGGGVDTGMYNLDRRTTLLELLCQISEINGADLKRAYVLRHGQKIKEDFSGLFFEGDVSEDITIEPNDVIFFPSLVDKNVYVVGAVNDPSFIQYREGLTVMEAILEAGGFTRFAKQNDVVIFRKDGDNEVSIPVRAKDLIKEGALGQNVKLKPGDYVVVKEGIF